jgi:HEAT repeat protein
MRGETATRDHTPALLKALNDPSIDVRIPAAQALGQFGDEAALAKALSTLSALAAPKDHDVLTAMAALAAIEALGHKADSLKPQIAALDPTGPAPDDRYNSYVPRLIENIVPKPQGEKPKGKGKNKNKAKGGSK